MRAPVDAQRLEDHEDGSPDREGGADVDVLEGLPGALPREGVDDPYGRYSALLREQLDSFMEALEGRRRRERAA